jgi:YVTN family beta-propeller protein
VSAFDTATNLVARTIGDLSMLGWPSGVAVAPDGRMVYVTNCGSGVCVIDRATDTLASTIATGPSSGAAFRDDGANAYVLCPSGLCVVDTGTGAVTATLPVGGSDIAVGRTRLSDLDHFKCYKARTAVGAGAFKPRTVTLSDAFETKTTTVQKPTSVCLPVDTNGEGIIDPAARLECYTIRDVKGQPKFTSRKVQDENTSGTDTLTLTKAGTLCVPARTDGQSTVLKLDNFKCYTAKAAAGTAKFQKRTVTLTDEFETKNTTVVKPVSICNPVDEDGAGITTPLAHLECYKISDVKGQSKFTARNVSAQNAFGSETLTVQKADTLCVPSLSSSVP